MSTNAATSQISARATLIDTRVASEMWLQIGDKEYRLTGKVIRIGRAADNQIVIDHKSASRYHAIITIEDGEAVLEDLQSRNGIKVGGRKVKRAALENESYFEIGDVEGFFVLKQKEKTNTKSVSQTWRQVAQQSIVAKWDALNQKQKVIVGAFVALAVATMVLMSAGSSTQLNNLKVEDDQSSLNQKAIANVVIPRSMIQRCIDLEDLGTFGQAKQCLEALPFTAEVKVSLERIEKRQKQMTETRYKEAKQAFDNYYYDIAIQKWQEVLLVADERSDFRIKAVEGIQRAEERRRAQ